MAEARRLLHLDIKTLGRIDGVGHGIHGDRQRRGRGVGWEYVHVAIDDHSRVAYVEVLPDQLAPTCAAFLRRTLAWFAARGVAVRRVMSEGQWLCVRSLSRHVRGTPAPPSPYAAVHTENERDS